MQLTGGIAFTSGVVINATISVDYLVVGGGASGASSGNGGSPGGGAGGLIYKAANSFEIGVLHTVTIGPGGAGGGQLTSNPGNSSTIIGTGVALTALYGGAQTKSSPYVTNGLPGGSGGGAPAGSTGGAGIQPQQSGDSGAYGFGNAGANGGPGDVGGGGAGAAATSSTGGAGKSYNISGTSQFYAGGGAGNDYNGGGGSGGSGVGGSAVTGQSRDAVVNTGSGGAGIWSALGSSGSGSSGICIFKYADSYPAATVTGSPTITVAGGYRTYIFTGNGTIIFN